MEKLGIPVFVKEFTEMKQQVEIMKGQLDSAVKGLASLNPHPGRSQRLLEERLAVTKAIVRAADSFKTQPPQNRERLVKAIKLAGEKLIVSHKQELKS